jgi:uncharacterized protein involved in outer membrane biogenesis
VFERLRRHPLLTFLTLLLGAAGVALTLFLASFELNDHRSQLQARLQEALQRPVKIGAIHFTLRYGLSLDLSAVAIGTPEDATSLNVDHLLLRLRLAPLLRRQLSFSSVLVDGAQLRIVKPAEEAAAAPPTAAPERMNALIELLRRTNINTLILRQGSATIRTGDQHYQLDKIDLELRHIAFLAPITVAAVGEVHVGAVRALWQLSGDIEAASADDPWQATRFDLTLGIKGVDLARLPKALGSKAKNFRLNGAANLSLRTYGAPATGLTFALRAEGQDFSLVLPDLYQAPLLAQEAEIKGIWQSGTPGIPGTIRALLLRLDTLNLRGEVVLPTAETPLLATLSIPDTPLAHLGPFIPDSTLPLLAAALRGAEVSGSAGMEKIALRWSQAKGMHCDNARFYLHAGRFTHQGVGLVENAEGEGSWQEETLTIKSMAATLLGGRSTGDGTMIFPAHGETLFDLKISSTAQAEALLPLLPALWQEKLQANGPLSFSGKISGTPSRLLLDLQSRFESAAVRFNNIPLKQAGEVGELLILGAIDFSGLELSHGRLLLPFAAARANGHLALDASGSYTLACDVSHLRIEKLPPFLAVQKELQGHGEVELHLDLSGDQKGLKNLRGSGEYRNLGMHLWDAVAEVHGGNGRMLLSREGIDFPAISGFVGRSPLRASAALTWLPEFQLILDLNLAKTRAADLVFKSPHKTFAAIQGRLVISGTAILFEQIAAEIAQGTRAVVNGHLTYTPASLVLDIVASQGDIAGIIALWQDGEKHAPRPHRSANAPPLTIDITTKIAAGDLFGVTFEDAAGTITLRDGALRIEPLRLKIGSGSASVAIATGPLEAEHPWLRVVGEGEQIDAAQVQKQLLGRQGSISGTLASTFVLQGELGRFLPTCNGNVDLLLDKGLLRGFTSISRALALFNVGKILTFNLPDVANDGLLFDQIKGNLTFTNGVVTSDDLALASPAFDMAFVGKADLAKDRLDFIIGVKPLQTVDKVLTSIPLAGWILTGQKKAFVIANFHVTGSSQDPKVEAIPFSSLSDMAVGIFKRTFGLPGKIVGDVKDLFR